MDFYFQLFLMSAFFGASCGYLAHKKKKNSFLWFAIGFFFGLFGLLFLFLQTLALPRQKTSLTIQKVEKTQEAPCLNSLSPYSDKMWYYVDSNHQPTGPISFHFLQKKIQEGSLSVSTLVWNEELPSWKKLQELLSKEELSTNLL
jgi:hypothetical protein